MEQLTTNPAANLPLPESLIAQAAAGDQDALGELLEALRSELVMLIRQARVPASDRDDAAQEAVLVVMACASAYDAELGTFRGYVCTSVRKMLRRFHGTPSQDYHLIDEPMYEADAASLDAEEVLQRAPYAEIVREYFGVGREERTMNQIAAVRRMSPGAVRRALQESLEAMRSLGGVSQNEPK